MDNEGNEPKEWRVFAAEEYDLPPLPAAQTGTERAPAPECRRAQRRRYVRAVAALLLILAAGAPGLLLPAWLQEYYFSGLTGLTFLPLFAFTDAILRGMPEYEWRDAGLRLEWRAAYERRSLFRNAYFRLAVTHPESGASGTAGFFVPAANLYEMNTNDFAPAAALERLLRSSAFRRWSRAQSAGSLFRAEPPSEPDRSPVALA